MNSYLKSQLELARKHHVLFLDRGLANEMAAEKNIIIEGHVQRPQVCFYLGAATAGDADNLIHLAPETLIDFFLQSDLPLPTFFIIVIIHFNNLIFSYAPIKIIKTSKA